MFNAGICSSKPSTNQRSRLSCSKLQCTHGCCRPCPEIICPPTPAFAEAEAAPGTTGGVELGSFVAWRSSVPFVFLAFKAIAFYWRSSLPFARLQTFQNRPNALLAPLTPQAKAPRPHQQLFLGLQGDINTFFLAFKPAVCQASNRPKHSKGFFGTPDPAGQGTKATSTAFSWPSRQH